MNAQPVLTYTVGMPFEKAEAAVRAALLAQGFGILTEVDLAATLRQKLGVETRPHRLLGACNARIAHESLTANPDVAAFLPCGVAIREGRSTDETIVTVQNPQLIAGAFSAPGLAAPAEEAFALLKAALETVGVEV